MKRRAKKKLPIAVAALYGATRRPTLGQEYTHAVEHMRARKALEAGTKARNYQIQYGNILESIQRLPPAFHRSAMEKLGELGTRLETLRAQYPVGFPRGPMPGQAEAFQRRRLVA